MLRTQVYNSLPKGPSRATLKARKRRVETTVKQRVRAACVMRDGVCRVATDRAWDEEMPIAACAGPSEWAHLRPRTRAHTRGMAPSKRHQRTWTLMLCRAHHRAYDAGRLLIDIGGTGADGPLVFHEIA